MYNFLMSDQNFPPCFYRVSVMALIFKDNKVLLIKESDGRWSLPGGGLEVGESFESGIKRELIEEIGINAIEISPQPIYTWTLIDISKHGNKIPKLILTFQVKVDSFEFKGNSEEGVKFGFFDKDEIKGLNLHPNTAELPNVWTN